jgi:hypothetical protein
MVWNDLRVSAICGVIPVSPASIANQALAAERHVAPSKRDRAHSRLKNGIAA